MVFVEAMSSALFGRRLGLQWGDPQASPLQNRSNLFLDAFFHFKVVSNQQVPSPKIAFGTHIHAVFD